VVPATEGTHCVRYIYIYFIGTYITRRNSRCVPGACDARAKKTAVFFRRSNASRARTTPRAATPSISRIRATYSFNPDPLLRRRPGQGDSVLYFFSSTTYYYFPTRIIFVRTQYSYIGTYIAAVILCFK